MIGMVALSVNKQKIDYLFSKYGQKRVMDMIFNFYFEDLHYQAFKDYMS